MNDDLAGVTGGFDLGVAGSTSQAARKSNVHTYLISAYLSPGLMRQVLDDSPKYNYTHPPSSADGRLGRCCDCAIFFPSQTNFRLYTTLTCMFTFAD